MIKIVVNAKEVKLKKGISIKEMLKELGFSEDYMGVAINLNFIPKDMYDKTILKEGDSIEVLSPICGG